MRTKTTCFVFPAAFQSLTWSKIHAEALECFLSWIKFTNVPASHIAQNPLIPQCFEHVAHWDDLSETATDTIVEVLRTCSMDICAYQPVIQVVLSHLGLLRLASLCSGVGNGGCPRFLLTGTRTCKYPESMHPTYPSCTHDVQMR